MPENLKTQIEKGEAHIKAVGQILLGLCEADAHIARLVEQDLENPDMSLEKCFAKMREIAQKKQKNNCYYMLPEEAEKTIRDFYGIPERKAGTASQHQTEILDLADLMDL